ncbi:ROK family transcriptional regulator [Streptomyces sp. GC420]|uniref:ROK family transcriptional regulator n=1 Tax=Streptomyces sp. GC420 TaxID=2697568 RepID=UPI00141500DE|nr:ROK family transcriptional regulator [Streptomyces sp. GC420]NBM19290.1 ROK family protein [Streptomyces sp. GC420]
MTSVPAAPPAVRTASPSTARAINDRLALRLLQERGPLTATQLKALTGLSRPTVADLVERLRVSGLIRVVGESGAERRGPNARLYGIAADRAYLAALDVRTHSVQVLVADLLGRTLAEATRPVGTDGGAEKNGGAKGKGAGKGKGADDAGGTEEAVAQVVALLERTAREAGAPGLHTVGIGAPGLVDPSTGELRDTGGLPAWHRSLVAVLNERLPATVLLENETNLAAVAEQRIGAARDQDTFVLLWLGHGTGAAVVLDGSLRRGASGGAGEIGWLPVPLTAALPSATHCEGGFHSLAGSGAIVELAAEHGITAAVEPGGVPGAALVRAALAAVAGAGAGAGAGASAGSFLDTLAERIALGAASVAAVLDPGCVVLGGEIGHAGGGALAARVEARLSAMSPLPTRVRAGSLGGTAVLHGALLAARDAAQDELFSPRG